MHSLDIPVKDGVEFALVVIFLLEIGDDALHVSIEVPAKERSEIELDVDPRRDVDAKPDVVLKNEGSMVQTCRNINVHVVNTDIMLRPT